MVIWEDYEWGYSPLWYKCAILLFVMWGAQAFYHNLHTPYPRLPGRMMVGDMVEHPDHGWMLILEAKYTKYWYQYRCRIMKTGKEEAFTNFDFTEGFNHVSHRLIEYRLSTF